MFQSKRKNLYLIEIQATSCKFCSPTGNLKAHASGVILAHNHPSNDPTPSESDVQITKKLMEAGSVLNIMVLDHLVISGDGSYYSLGDEGRL